jgi:serine/threonine protein phosphatase 1
MTSEGRMRHLAIGDIHGCIRALTTLAAFVPFQPEDELIVLGDYIDRAPASRAVLDWLIARRQQGPFIALRGNHEAAMLKARYSADGLLTWKEMGGDWALRSYAPLWRAGTVDDVPEEHWKFLANTRRYWETARHFFVHANAHPEISLHEQHDYMLLWEFFNNPPPHCSGKVMVCGHTPQKTGRPWSIGHAVCIDTGACLGLWLTCLDVDTGHYWQANEKGETREGWLNE